MYADWFQGPKSARAYFSQTEQYFHARIITLTSGQQEKLNPFAFTESEKMRPEPFKVRFIPRSEARVKVILQEVPNARKT
jgi:hypothetical protein